MVYAVSVMGGLAVVFFWLWMRRRAMCFRYEENMRVMRRLGGK